MIDTVQGAFEMNIPCGDELDTPEGDFFFPVFTGVLDQAFDPDEFIVRLL